MGAAEFIAAPISVRYSYAPHGGLWGIWKTYSDKPNESVFVKDYHTKEEAREYVYRLNGWNMRDKDKK